MLTNRQRLVLRAIVETTQVRGYPPTLRELCDALGVSSTNGMSTHLAALERKGFISRQPRQARSITVLKLEAAGERVGS